MRMRFWLMSIRHSYRGGRLVIIDREPRQLNTASPELAEHEISPDHVETELRRGNFEIDRRQDDFIEHDSYGENWWMIAAHKPEQVKPQGTRP